MANRTSRAGETIYLRAQFKDDYGDIAQAENVIVHVYNPDADDLTDLSEATLVSGVATYLGQGIFEYGYAIPSIGPDGVWHDVWSGDLLSHTVTSTLQFDVTTSGIAYSFENQLHNNDIVQVTVASGIQATDGTNLAEAYEMEFLTTCAPSYSSSRKLRMEVGAFITEIPDMVLEIAILEASLEADALTFAPIQFNSDLYNHARREYVSCAASSLLLTNTGNLLLKTKTLADLHVEYDTTGARDAQMRLLDCMDVWKPQLIAGGGYKKSTQPSSVVKGEWDPDRPNTSRMWYSTEEGNVSRRMPAANDRVRETYQRRHKRTWSSPNKKWW